MNSDFVEEHKLFADSKWDVKPIDLYAGKGIFIGKDFAYRLQELKKIVFGILKSGDIYICQEFIEPYESLSFSLDYNESDLLKEPGLYKNTICIYMPNDQFGGLYSRFGPGYDIGNYTGGHCTARYFIQ